jgi:hypothetical protein
MASTVKTAISRGETALVRMVFLAAIIIIVLTVEMWLPIAVIMGILKLIFTLSLSLAWEAFKAVPIWVWDTTYSVLT